MAAACSVARSNVETETFSLGYMEPLIQREEEEELTEAIEKPKGNGRKRVRACTKKKLGLRKNAPNTSIDDVVSMGCCMKSCILKLSKVALHQIRDKFNVLTYEEQNQYLAGLMIRRMAIKSSGHMRKENPTAGKNGKKMGRPPADEASFTIEYNVRNEKGINVTICQKAFILIHGFGKKRVEVLRKKVASGSLCPEPDRRGKHSNRPHKVPELIHKKVREHIMSFPARQSHYSRHKNSGRMYLSADLSIERMYELFLSENDPEYLELKKRKESGITNDTNEIETKPICSKHYYHDVFVQEFNIHFGYPRSDTCDTCDRLRLAISETSADVEGLQEELSIHLKAADEGYDALKKDITLCKNSHK